MLELTVGRGLAKLGNAEPRESIWDISEAIDEPANFKASERAAK
jgi:hypothetical protein